MQNTIKYGGPIEQTINNNYDGEYPSDLTRNEEIKINPQLFNNDQNTL